MSLDALQVIAIVRVKPAGDLPVARPVTPGWGPVFFHAGELYPARISPDSPAIKPGRSGRLTLLILSSSLGQAGLRPGDCFELRDGAESVIATGSVETASPFVSEAVSELV